MQNQTVRYLFYKTLGVVLFPLIYVLTVLCVISVVTIPLAILFFWISRRLRRMLQNLKEPSSPGMFLAPWFVPLFYTLTVIVAAFAFFTPSTGLEIFLFAMLPWNWCLFLFLDLGMFIELFIYVPLVPAIIAALVGIWKALDNTTHLVFVLRPFAFYFAITLVLAATAYDMRGRFRSKILGKDYDTQKVFDETGKNADWYRDVEYKRMRDETDLKPFKPFDSGNELVKVESPTLAIESAHPHLHGALALYPVYAAAVEALYRRNLPYDISDIIKGGTSPDAFNTLLDGKADIVFMGPPSAKQLAEAEERGIALTLTPIASEAFVFFVNRENRVGNLTTDQIRKIYSREITRWNAVGGNLQHIIPFQRPEGSGSQTAMERIMGDTPLTTPVREEYQQMMGGIVNRVADYRNYGNSIGYSFRYYVTVMFQHDGVKLLSVNGVAPTVENIRSGAYPFVSPFVAVSLEDDPNPNTQKLIGWLLSPQGQDMIQRVGYVPL